MGFMHANKSSDLLVWWTLDKATRLRTHASLRLASEQVSSRFRTGFGPDSIMDFGLNRAVGLCESDNSGLIVDNVHGVTEINVKKL